MIKIYNQEIEIEKRYEDAIRNKITNCTGKSNLNPQLLIKTRSTSFSNKLFIGNKTRDGIWITKNNIQLIIPDIIARFSFNSEQSILKIRYSIGFSSIVGGFFWIVLFSLIFICLSNLELSLS